MSNSSSLALPCSQIKYNFFYIDVVVVLAFGPYWAVVAEKVDSSAGAVGLYCRTLTVDR